MKERFLKLSITSDLPNGKAAVEKIQKFIQKNYRFLSVDDAHDLRLIFSELIYNAIIHGNKQDCKKEIHVVIELDDDGRITSVVKDEGDGYDYSRLLNDLYVLADCASPSYGDSGRGIMLVSALCDKISFNKTGSEITFSKRVLDHAQYHNSGQ